MYSSYCKDTRNKGCMGKKGDKPVLGMYMYDYVIIYAHFYVDDMASKWGGFWVYWDDSE